MSCCNGGPQPDAAVHAGDFISLSSVSRYIKVMSGIVNKKHMTSSRSDILVRSSALLIVQAFFVKIEMSGFLT